MAAPTASLTAASNILIHRKRIYYIIVHGKKTYFPVCMVQIVFERYKLTKPKKNNCGIVLGRITYIVYR